MWNKGIKVKRTISFMFMILLIICCMLIIRALQTGEDTWQYVMLYWVILLTHRLFDYILLLMDKTEMVEEEDK